MSARDDYPMLAWILDPRASFPDESTIVGEAKRALDEIDLLRNAVMDQAIDRYIKEHR